LRRNDVSHRHGQRHGEGKNWPFHASPFSPCVEEFPPTAIRLKVREPNNRNERRCALYTIASMRALGNRTEPKVVQSDHPPHRILPLPIECPTLLPLGYACQVHICEVVCSLPGLPVKYICTIKCHNRMGRRSYATGFACYPSGKNSSHPF